MIKRLQFWGGGIEGKRAKDMKASCACVKCVGLQGCALQMVMTLPPDSARIVAAAATSAGPSISDTLVEKLVKMRWQVLFDSILHLDPKAYLDGKRANIPNTCDECAAEYEKQYNDMRRRTAPPSMDRARQWCCGEAVSERANNLLYPDNFPGKKMKTMFLSFRHLELVSY